MSDLITLFGGLGTAAIGGTGGYLLRRSLTLRNWFYGNDSGILACYPELPIAQVERAISRGKRIAILQTWMSNQVHFRSGLEQAVRNGATAQILLADPKGVMIEYRAREFGPPMPSEEARGRLRSNVRELKEVCDRANISNCVDIRVYTGTPVMSLYRIDDIVYIGMFWRSGSALNGPQIKAKAGGYYEKQAQRSFDAIWNDPTTVPYRE